jgi:hypothetical protein
VQTHVTQFTSTSIREDAHHPCAPLDFFVQPFCFQVALPLTGFAAAILYSHPTSVVRHTVLLAPFLDDFNHLIHI